MAKVEMKGPAGLVPVDEKDVRAYKARGYTVLGEHTPVENVRADCSKVDSLEPPKDAEPVEAPEPIDPPDPPAPKSSVAEGDPVEEDPVDEADGDK